MPVQQIGSCIVSGSSPVNCGGDGKTFVTDIKVFAVGANCSPGTTISIINSLGDVLFTWIVPGVSTLLTSYTGPILSYEDINQLIPNGDTPCVVKLSNALSTGYLIVNVGYA
jgi:hypothetical protein